MLESADDEATGVDFNHPFTPYDVQLQFMRTVYNVLQQGDGQVGILESPTGTVSVNRYLFTLSTLLRVALIFVTTRTGQVSLAHLCVHHMASPTQESSLRLVAW